MKPQSLQDAIKAQALARAKKVERGEWKEPVVKEHKLTAEDLKASPKVSAPATAAPMYAAVPMNNAEVTAIKNLMQAKLLPLVEGMSRELKGQNSTISALQHENKEMRERFQQQANAVSNLKQDNNELKEMLKLQMSAISAMQRENKELKELIKEQANNAERAAYSTSDPMTPVAPSKPGVVYPMSPYVASPPVSPSKKVKPPASLEPHSPETLLEQQRKDKALRHFMKTKEGLFDTKYMSLRAVDGGNLVMFKKKVYVPEKLRAKTIEYYKNEHDEESKALEVLRKNCCWPDLEKDFFSSPN